MAPACRKAARRRLGGGLEVGGGVHGRRARRARQREGGNEHRLRQCWKEGPAFEQGKKTESAARQDEQGQERPTDHGAPYPAPEATSMPFPAPGRSKTRRTGGSRRGATEVGSRRRGEFIGNGTDESVGASTAAIRGEAEDRVDEAERDKSAVEALADQKRAARREGGDETLYGRTRPGDVSTGSIAIALKLPTVQPSRTSWPTPQQEAEADSKSARRLR